MSTYTKEQQDYRNSILPKSKYVAPLPKPKVEVKELTTTDYMRNCITRIEWFQDDEKDIEDFKHVIRALKLHINELEIKYKIK